MIKAPVPSLATAQTTAPLQQEDEFVEMRRRKMMKALMILAAVFAGFYLWKKWSALEKEAPRDGPPAKAVGMADEGLLDLAIRIKSSAVKVYGVSRCSWTKRQRELFGGRDAAARQIFEKAYVECTPEKCAHIEGFPTWEARGQLFPGFKDLDQIQALLNHTERPDEAPKLAPPTLPQAPPAPAPPAPASAPPAPAPPAPPAPAPPAPPASPASLPVQAGVEEPRVVVLADTADESKVERVRGVSSYAPLAVPNLPGTEAFALDVDYAVDQAFQGNVPRGKATNPNPIEQIASQMTNDMKQAAVDQARGASDVVTKANYPQSSTITIGDPFEDKRTSDEKLD